MRPKTIFLDIDGTLLKHHGSLSLCGIMPPVLLDGVHEKLDEWDKKGYRIILITGRKESMREITEKQLQTAGIYYDRLVMGIGNGPRVLINDTCEGQETAFGITVERNKGLRDVKITTDVVIDFIPPDVEAPGCTKVWTNVLGDYNSYDSRNWRDKTPEELKSDAKWHKLLQEGKKS